MARRRYQKGSLLPRRGLPKNGKWIGRWREDEIQPDGTRTRPYRYDVLGTVEDYPTRKLALRELEKKIASINSPAYRPRPTATFRQFAERWTRETLSQMKASYQASERSRLRCHLLPFFDDLALKDINGATVQGFISASKLSAKSARNCIATLRTIRNAAVAWGYIGKNQDWFAGVTLPEWVKPESPSFTEDEMRMIIATAEEPYRTFYWILGETGIRLGECCGLRVSNLLLDLEIVVIRWSVWHGKMGSTKSKRPRTFPISPKLAAHLRSMIEPIKGDPDAFLFRSKHRTPWIGDDVVKHNLKPLLKTLGIKQGVKRVGAHAFRHGNASLMDRHSVPLKVRTDRLGHMDDALTLGVYTHAASEDHRATARTLGDLLVPDVARSCTKPQEEGPEPKALTHRIQ